MSNKIKMEKHHKKRRRTNKNRKKVTKKGNGVHITEGYCHQSHRNYKQCLYLDTGNYSLLYEDGTMVWYNNFEQIHRGNDEPAIIYPDGTKFWYLNGSRHREEGKPAVIYPNGSKEWWYNDNFVK